MVVMPDIPARKIWTHPFSGKQKGTIDWNPHLTIDEAIAELTALRDKYGGEGEIEVELTCECEYEGIEITWNL